MRSVTPRGEATETPTSGLLSYHAHDDTSSDAAGGLVEHAHAAVRAGLKELCLTNHAEARGPDGRWSLDATEAIDRLGREIEAAEVVRAEVPDLVLRVGAELEFRPEWASALERIAAALPLDYLLGSVHVVDGHDLSSGEDADAYFAVRSPERAYGRYFELVAEMVAWGGFDVVAHLDLAKRFGHRTYGPWDPRSLEDPIRAVLRAVAAADLGIEINTSGFSQPPRAPYPDPRIVGWALEEGVPRLTLGADSHAPGRVASGLLPGAEVAAEAGWTTLTGFDASVPRPIPILRQPITWVAWSVTTEGEVRANVTRGGAPGTEARAERFETLAMAEERFGPSFGEVVRRVLSTGSRSGRWRP